MSDEQFEYGDEVETPVKLGQKATVIDYLQDGRVRVTINLWDWRFSPCLTRIYNEDQLRRVHRPS